MQRIKRSEEVVKVRTLHSAILKFPRKDFVNAEGNEFVTAAAIKAKACANIALNPEDVMLLRNAALIGDDEVIKSENQQQSVGDLFLLLKSSAEAICKVAFKVTKNGESDQVFLDIPVNTRVSKLKKELCKSLSRELSIPAAAQRMVCRGQILHDYCCIGDYLITDRIRYSHSVAAATAAADLTVFVTAAVDLSKEVPVILKMLNGQSFKEYFSVSVPLVYLREILWRQHCLPKDIPIHFYLTDKASGHRQLLDTTRTLYDYEICSEVSLHLYPYIISEFLEVTRPGSPISIAAVPSSVFPSAASDSSKRRSTAKCGPQKNQKSVTIATATTTSTSTSSTGSKSPTGLFGLKKGFLGGSMNKKSKK